MVMSTFDRVGQSLNLREDMDFDDDEKAEQAGSREQNKNVCRSHLECV